MKEKVKPMVGFTNTTGTGNRLAMPKMQVGR